MMMLIMILACANVPDFKVAVNNICEDTEIDTQKKSK